MIYLNLFLTFFEIGLFTFGGGYAMISLIRDKALVLGWLTEEELLNMTAVAESTPGPIAVNMATFVGSTRRGSRLSVRNAWRGTAVLYHYPFDIGGYS